MGRTTEVRPNVPAVSTARSFDLVLPLDSPSLPAAPPARYQGFRSLSLSLTPEEKPIGRTDQLNAY